MLQALFLPGRAPDPHRHDLQAGSLSDARSDPTDDWNFPLLLHVLGAMLLVGVGSRPPSRRSRSAGGATHWTLSRLGFWALLVVAFPPGG